jgi:hypothetical protein
MIGGKLWPCRSPNPHKQIYPRPSPMPSVAERRVPPPPTSKIKPSFQTLIREHSFQYPSTSKPEFPALQAAVQPHIDSFNAITADGLLEIAVKDVGKKTVFDHKGPENGGRGNKLTFWVEDVQLSRPALSTRERTSLNRRIYPSEVCAHVELPAKNVGSREKN